MVDTFILAITLTATILTVTLRTIELILTLKLAITTNCNLTID
jgi:hypothetical protein